jgi:hypothetical protein
MRSEPPSMLSTARGRPRRAAAGRRAPQPGRWRSLKDEDSLPDAACSLQSASPLSQRSRENEDPFVHHLGNKIQARKITLEGK